MDYRSVEDLNRIVKESLQLLPSGVVGVAPMSSRSITAPLLANHLDVELVPLDRLLSDRNASASISGAASGEGRPADAQALVVIDDVVTSSEWAREVRRRLAEASLPHRTVLAAAFESAAGRQHLDLTFASLGLPYVFEWSVMRDAKLRGMCVDIDGILCADPTVEENDDGARYKEFLACAAPRWVPSQPIGWLVTSRLERYRTATETWLAERGVAYDHLVMLDLPSAAARRASGAHGTFKAAVYAEVEATLFIESEWWQAEQIARLSQKPVLCLPHGRLVEPGEAAGASRRARSRMTASLQNRLRSGLRTGS